MSDAGPLGELLRKGGLYSTYTADLALFRSLGLTPYADAPHADWFTVGGAQLAYDGGEVYATVTIEASCWPATFWRLTVRPTKPESPDKARVLVKTGSGTLSKYWPLVLMLAQQMVTVTMGAP